MDEQTKYKIAEIKRAMDESRSVVLEAKVTKFLFAILLIFIIGTAVRYVYQNGII